MRTRGFAALLCAGALLLTSCSGDSGSDHALATEPALSPSGIDMDGPAPISPVEIPESDQILITQGIAYAVPDAWTVQQQPADDGLYEASASGELPDGDLASLTVITVPTSESGVPQWRPEVTGLGEVLDEQEFLLEGLSSHGPIVLLDLTQDIDEVTMRSWVLLFEHGDERTYSVSFMTEQDAFDPAVAAERLGTLRDS